MRFIPAALTALIGHAVATGASASCNPDLSVKITGGVVHGSVDAATPAVRQFLGIPYARPPLGDLRYAAPQPAPPFGELNATVKTPSCIQYATNVPNVFNELVPEFLLDGLNYSTGPISEDCLTLSIWAPRGTAAKKLPVIIFFYGGAFTNEGVNVPYFVPSNWIQRTQGHIVVSFNHRDNIFGYPNAAGLPDDQQNVGLLDMRLAIEWVRDNIASFGGDPARIGLWGQSSGGSAIGYYTYAYPSDPIANSIIMDSGNEFIDILTYDNAHANFSFAAAHVGCGNLPPAEELACMRRVPAQTLEDFIHVYSDANNGINPPLLTFTPVIDNVTVFSNFTARALAGNIARLPALIGSNAQDGIVFINYSDNPSAADLASADDTTMVWFFCPGYQAARVRVKAHKGEVPVYRFVYAGNFSNVSPRGWMGAYHESEEPLVFGTHALFRGNSTDLEWRTSWAMQDVWVDFVASGGWKVPVEGWGGWKEVEGGRVVVFGEGVPAKVVDMSEKERNCSIIG